MMEATMDPQQMVEPVCYGVLIAVAIRWLLSLEVGLKLTILVGALSLLFTPWLRIQLGVPAVDGVSPDTLAGVVINGAALGISQLLRPS
jgi:hypothetical protein